MVHSDRKTESPLPTSTFSPPPPPAAALRSPRSSMDGSGLVQRLAMAALRGASEVVSP